MMSSPRYIWWFAKISRLFTGVSDEEMGHFAGAGEKEASEKNWKAVINWDDASRDTSVRIVRRLLFIYTRISPNDVLALPFRCSVC